MNLRSLVSILVCVGLVACGPEDDGGASSEGSGDGSDASDGSSGSSASNSTTSVSTTEGSSSSASTATTGAECDPFPSEGEACSTPGAYCSSDCSDQCQFCNILECHDGVWSNAEVFPVPCLECEQVCPLSVAAGCSGGAPDEATCVMGCEAIMAGPCRIEHSAARACVGETPTFSCDTDGNPIVAGCEAEFVALYACLGL